MRRVGDNSVTGRREQTTFTAIGIFTTGRYKDPFNKTEKEIQVNVIWDEFVAAALAAEELKELEYWGYFESVKWVFGTVGSKSAKSAYWAAVHQLHRSDWHSLKERLFILPRPEPFIPTALLYDNMTTRQNGPS